LQKQTQPGSNPLLGALPMTKTFITRADLESGKDAAYWKARAEAAEAMLQNESTLQELEHKIESAARPGDPNAN
jgi:hypothetical protein